MSEGDDTTDEKAENYELNNDYKRILKLKMKKPRLREETVSVARRCVRCNLCEKEA